MATVLSDQLTVIAAAGNSKNDGILDLGGKLRVAYFSFLTTGVNNADTVSLCYLPKNARLIEGTLVTEALGASVTLSIGTDTGLTTGTSATAIAAGAANLLAALSVASASNTDFIQTYLLGAGAVTTALTLVYTTVGGATPTTAKQVLGWVLYLQN